MIKSFLFENFKSFEKAELNMEPLTSVVGTNASGKSNAVEGIKILAECASGLELKIILDGTPTYGGRIRGGSKSCPRYRTKSFRLGCLISKNQSNDLLYEIKILVNGSVQVEEEGLYIVPVDKTSPKSRKIFKTKTAESERAEIKVMYNNGRVGNNPTLICSRDISILSQLVSRFTKEEIEEEYFEDLHYVINTLRGVKILAPDTQAMREYCRLTDTELHENCENVSAVMYLLCQDEDNKNRLLNLIKNLPENEITDISFVTTKIGDVLFGLRERYINSKELVDARQLSDGTLRCLAAIVSVMVSKPDSLVIIEEVDNGIHPSRTLILIKMLYELGKDKNTDILITTHNAMLMNQYERAFLNGVSVVYREKERGTSRFVALPDIEAVPELFAVGGLGDAMIHDQLLRAIKDGRNKADYSWMEDDDECEIY